MSFLDEMDALAGISQKSILGQNKSKSYLDEMDAIAGADGSFSPKMELYKAAKGFAGGMGAVPDLASQYIASPLLNAAQSQPLSPEDETLTAEQQSLNSGLPQEQISTNNERFLNSLNSAQSRLQNPGISESLEGSVESTIGQKIPSGGLSYDFGSILAPIPGGGGFVNAGKQLLKHGPRAAAKVLKPLIGREVKQAAGTSAALNLTPSLTEEGSGARVAENLFKGIAGGRAASKVSLDKLKSTPKKLLDSIKNVPLAAASIGAKPNPETFNLAKKHNINLPLNVGMDSSPLNFLMNNAFKSMFSSRNYKDSMKKANESLGKSIRKNIDVLGEPNKMRASASQDLTDLIRKDESALQRISNKKYETMIKSATPNIEVSPNNTKEFIYSMGSKLRNPVKGPSTSAVTTQIEKLAKHWGVIPPSTDLIKKLERDPAYADKLLKKIGETSRKIPVSELMETKQELQEIARKDAHLQGKKKGFYKLINSITKDIESNTSPELQKSIKEYNEWFKGNIATRFRNPTAKSLLREEMPKEAYKLTATPQGISKLKKIAGDSPEGLEAFNALKKAKVRNILRKTFKDEKTGPGAFYSTFHSDDNKELLENLVGKKSYENLREISQVSKDFSQAGQDLLNTSGTSHVSKDYERMKGALKEALGLFGLASVPGGKVTVATGIAGVNLGSRLVSNEKFVNALRKYALAKKAGQEKIANNLKTRVLRIGTIEAKAARKALHDDSQDYDEE